MSKSLLVALFQEHTHIHVISIHVIRFLFTPFFLRVGSVNVSRLVFVTLRYVTFVFRVVYLKVKVQERMRLSEVLLVAAVASLLSHTHFLTAVSCSHMSQAS